MLISKNKNYVSNKEIKLFLYNHKINNKINNMVALCAFF